MKTPRTRPPSPRPPPRQSNWRRLRPLLLPAALWALPAAPAATFPSDALLKDGLPPDARPLKLGDRAPDFSLLGVDGKRYSLADFSSAPILMVIFMSNHCAVSHAAETRVFPYYEKIRGRGVAVVAINPNNPDAIREDELGYTQYNDGYDDMKRYAKDRSFPFPYLYDGDTQATAKAYGCLCTPHVFIFDRDRRLRYMGRFDNSRLPDPASVTRSDAPNAIEALLAGEPVTVPATPPVGCSTKWALKAVDVEHYNAAWATKPVTVDPIDAAGVAALAKNDTPRYRLINVWATWCAPCVHEFPGLVRLSQRFENRAFDLITISLDDPKEPAPVQRFLEQQHAAVPDPVVASLTSEGRRTNNYRYTGADTDAFGRALDAAWPGPLPYTVVVAPGGQIVYRHSGEVDLDELRAFLVAKLGAYYDQARIKAVR